MKIMVVSGSQRSDSQSRRMADEFKKRLETLDVEVSLVDLFETPLPQRLDDVWGNVDGAGDEVAALTADAESCDGFVIITPEWGGMATPAIKSLFVSVGGFAHKPGLIVSVSASRGGSYPVAELRMSSYKNSKIVYIPDHLILRNVGTLFTGESNDENDYMTKRVDFSINALLEYAKAMAPLRDIEALDVESYQHGM